MTLKANQETVGTRHDQSPPNEVARAGRDSFFKPSGSVGVEHGKDSSEGGRTGRDSGFGRSGNLGIGKGKSDTGNEESLNRVDEISGI